MASRGEVERALIAFKSDHGHVAMRELIQRVAGVDSISEIPEGKFGAIMAALNAGGSRHQPSSESRAAIEELDPAAIYQRWNSFRRAPRPTE